MEKNKKVKRLTKTVQRRHAHTHQVQFTPCVKLFQLRATKISHTVRLPQFITVLNEVLPAHTCMKHYSTTTSSG